MPLLMLNSLDKVLNHEITEVVKLVTLIISFSPILSLVLSLVPFFGLIIAYKNLSKDRLILGIDVNRAKGGWLPVNFPKEEFILFEVYNKGVSSTVINEIGIIIPKKIFKDCQIINLVDLPYSTPRIKNPDVSPYVELPGILSSQTTGRFLLNYTSLKEKAVHYQEFNLSSEKSEFIGSQRLINTFKKLKEMEIKEGKYIQITPYIMTGSGKKCVGKKSMIKLGYLSDCLD